MNVVPAAAAAAVIAAAANKHWQQMKNMMETALVLCGLSKGPCSHEETWWWNEEVAEAVRERKKKYRNWKKRKSTEAWKEYNTHNHFMALLDFVQDSTGELLM